MVISVRKWLQSVKFAVLFIALAYLLYKVLGTFGGYLFPEDKYRIPDGSAVKAFQTEQAGNYGIEFMADRLKLFYWYGE
ncbi:DUF4227 family protein [Paenibacillus woosongensis]|uniref:DUF4227 family protein n=1 Tax=Paenibacillus woosongensis TaxID=307580 RepID=A0A7X2Z0H7_9BACL|nr:DUF4227 family protein [Paenibacillus woosongensis]MUG44753.1 DUF4227 family protein [Paenibacillus woosongensis]